ncbi:MAG: heavy metal translocating P-type ATPase [Oscillospiraceae bacterium]|nr:heavy metal translocating P-type ATPase [Oscillospiraceae bacterium]
MHQKFSVTGMTCSACSANVDRTVKKLSGISAVNVNLLSNSMTVEYDEKTISASEIINAVQQAGYGASLYSAKSEKNKKTSPAETIENELKSMKFRLAVSFVFMLPLMYISMGHMLSLPMPAFFHGTENAVTFAFTQFLLALPVLYVNRKYYIVGFKSLFKGAPNMDSLIAIGSSASMLYGIFAIYRIGYGLGHNMVEVVDHYRTDLYFESAVMILTLITVGKFLETRSKGKTGEAIAKLINLAPKTAVVERGGVEIEIPAEDIAIGDVVVIRPGQSIPADGIIIEGSSSIDQSALTGESIPVVKAVGDTVIAASVNKTGFFKFRASKVGDDTTLSQIIALVEEAAASKAPISKLADKVSGIFVPTVIFIAIAASAVWMLLGAEFEFALSIGIAVLVISCPCALGLATPVAIMVGTGKGAENGILIKSAEALETAHTINTVVLDKTGTITTGKPQVTDIITLPGVDETHFLLVAAAIEKPSEHPLADAIIQKANELDLPIPEAVDFVYETGQGVEAFVGGERFYAGNKAMMTSRGISLDSLSELAVRFAETGKTPLYFANDNGLLGIIAVADVVKHDSKAAISQMKKMGLEVIMLTGDNAKTAEAVCQGLEIDQLVAEVLPLEKEQTIRSLQQQGKKVAMIGDGINDAPALARADVGIAIGAGTDIAIDSADIVLLKSSLVDAVSAIQLSKAVIRNIKMNLFWAFFYNCVGIPLAAGVFYSVLGWKLSPMFGAAAMSMSSFCVVSNALRLKMFRPVLPPIEEPVNEAAQQPQTDDIETEYEGDDDKMKKVMTVNGMNCGHCQAAVEKALNALDGVESAKVDLKKKTATIVMAEDIADDVLMNAVSEAGFEPVSVTVKKGIFGL